ncbi:MAG: DUF805 domain-containing protein [Pseudomonadota bacterium]
MNFESLFVNPNGRTSRSHYIPALLTLLAAICFYVFLVTGLTAKWCTVVLLFPTVILHARRLHDMGHTAWLLLVPVALLIAAFAIWLRLADFGAQMNGVVPLSALAVSAAFVGWGCLGKGQSEVNRFGAPVAA